MFISFVRRDKRSYKEKTNMKKDFFCVAMYEKGFRRWKKR